MEYRLLRKCNPECLLHLVFCLRYVPRTLRTEGNRLKGRTEETGSRAFAGPAVPQYPTTSPCCAVLRSALRMAERATLPSKGLLTHVR